MHRTLLLSLTLMFTFIAQPALAADNTDTNPFPEIITLKNGARVQLNADFTWEYLFSAPEPISNTETSPETATANSAGSAAISTPVIDGALSADAISRAQLLRSTAKNGVTVRFIDSQWDSKGRLGLNFELSSTSSDNYVEIELEIQLFDDAGQQLSQHKVDVWQAIFRLPETYLRKGQTRKSDTIWLEGVDKNRWQQQLMTMRITDMSSR